jgi:small subunit ribosomal protein S6
MTSAADEEFFLEEGVDEPRMYECCVLYGFPLNQKEEADLQKDIEKIFGEAEATLVAKDVWGRRGLAYPIGGYREGTYVIYHYTLLPSRLRELDRSLRILKGVLRHMFVKPPKNYEIKKYSELFVAWQERSKIEAEQREREREEKLRKTVVEKVQRSAKRVPKKRTEEEVVQKPVSTQALEQELEKIVSDDAIDL